jgi:hypothetical protein
MKKKNTIYVENKVSKLFSNKFGNTEYYSYVSFVIRDKPLKYKL